MSSRVHQQALSEALAELPRPPRRRRRWRPIRGLVEWLLVLGTLVALVALVGVLSIMLAERELARRIYPNISVRGIAVGGMSLDQAQAQLERNYGEFLRHPVELQYGEQRWSPSAAELGLRLQVDAALHEAFALGRGDERLTNLRRAMAVWEQGFDLPLRLEVDQTVMQGYLLHIAAEVEQPTRAADLRLEGPEVLVQTEAWGTQVLIDETLADLTAVVQRLEPRSLALRTRTLEPSVRDSDIAPVAEELHLLLSGPVTLYGDTGTCAARGCSWELTPAQIATWLTLRPITTADGRPSFLVNLDPAGIRSALQPIAAALREEGTLPLVAWNGGNLQITQPGQPGRGLDGDEALASVSVAIQGSERSLHLPIKPIPPPVTERNLASLGISQQVGVGVSSFARSEAYRITNIRAGARRMHGVLIPPGGEFSFNTQLGPVDAANGFVEGLAIVDNRTQQEWGGGLCQVSTTVFRAAFFGGLPISERHAHAFRIRWYEELGEPPGLDAAIFTPYNDVRFRNDTGAWLLMESYVDLTRQRLSVALYGPPTGRTVTYSHRVLANTPPPREPVYIDDPTRPRGYFQRSDVAIAGIRVEVYRTISNNGQIVAQDTFPTEFKPWPTIYVRGTGR
ncbi:VanW family protein [Candidatus Viridilinea mediisalina]|uniref:Vanomycin resistance protein VanB n=1 Tax=Candidatus Viridilinea mediisalina TaxID=2024553 RepID=A0A2A6RJ60_9CHLR|nr:VanW family protein [Candidatus Viridilinea mediisalina]PDW02925.1 vanomycin resistance protein VanB [Candidatus Viridilinea mediisalina]